MPGQPAKIALVDFGLTKIIPEEFRAQLIVLTSAIVAQRPELVTDTMTDMGFRTRDEDPETYNALGEAFLGDVLRSGKAYADQEMGAEVNERLGRVLRGNPLVDVPGDVILIARVMGLLSLAQGVASISGFFLGLIGQAIGLQLLYPALGMLMLAVTAYTAIRSPLRRLD